MMLLDFFYSASIFVLSILLFRAIYTTKNRRLRLPPSPFGLPIIGHLHLLGPKIHHSFHNLYKRYGPIFHLRLGSNRCIVVSTPELAKEFLKTHELDFAYRKNSSAISLLTYHVSFAFAPYGPYWKYIKKITTYQLLGNRNLTHFEPIRRLETNRVLYDLMVSSKHGKSVNLTEEMIKLTSNIISQMMLSIRCSDTESGATNVRNVIRDVTELFGEFDVSDIIWFCKNTDLQGIKKRANGIHERYDALLEKIISDRERTRIVEKKNSGAGGGSGDGERNDFLDILMDAMEDDTSEVKLSRNHIKAIILDFLTAATDTTAISLEWALSELINNPRVLKKAQEEINNVVGNQRLVKELDTPNFPYIKAIIKETFRLHPPIPMVIRKSANDIQVAGYDVPKNTMLFVNIWSIGRNPSYWEKASEFSPERFLADTDGGGLSHMDINGQYFELMPFGTGRRGCPGMPLAMQELPTVLSLMIQCFDYIPLDFKGEKAERVMDMSERPGLTAPRANELMCLLKPRIDLPNLLGNVKGE
uniref:Flavone synthase II n=1 Tax=Gentiana triflora TaxID=55190 RepID=Q59I67_GENTR|nr:flavone synthase II [Gentiana triflora]